MQGLIEQDEKQEEGAIAVAKNSDSDTTQPTRTNEQHIKEQQERPSTADEQNQPIRGKRPTQQKPTTTTRATGTQHKTSTSKKRLSQIPFDSLWLLNVALHEQMRTQVQKNMETIWDHTRKKTHKLHVGSLSFIGVAAKPLLSQFPPTIK